MHFTFERHTLKFKQASGTSRGILTEKLLWIITLSANGFSGKGECSVIPGLSPDFISVEAYEQRLINLQKELNKGISESLLDSLKAWPSILFGLETALLDLQNGGKGIYFQNSFTTGKRRLPINGLIWMGDTGFMQDQIDQKLAEGYSTIKMKVGAIDFKQELQLLTKIRSNYSKEQITLRVDANGAFKPDTACEYLQQLADLDIHSIEQPIKPGQWKEMAQLCSITATPIALDEELIGIHEIEEKRELIEVIRPQYIILKPSLHGGISGTQEWINLADSYAIPWWMTSALESNIGLSAICQLVGEYDNSLPQGLGTGSLYETNFPSNLHIEKGEIYIKG